MGSDVEEMRAVPRAWRGWACVVVLLVLALGAMEDWYGRTDAGDLFGSDGVQYLDCARAIGRGDVRSALNPLWSQGYPALLAAARPLFAAGMSGDWVTTRVVNFLVFCFGFGSFVYLLAQVAGRRRDAVFWLSGVGVFVATQICLGQVSRVGPDELVSGLFFLVCGMLVRLVRRPGLRPGQRPRVGFAVTYGAALGLGFLAKAVFLPLGCVMLAALFVGLWKIKRRAGVGMLATVVFAVMVMGYERMLSRAVGYRTLGESGALNYAWHVNRLQKWVHWEGGAESAEVAWPKPWIARFAQWESRPPEFGMPVHADRDAGARPTVYVFHEPAVTATYVPYYDPAYWYAGYRHVVRWRYEAIDLVKNVGELGETLLMQPAFYAVLIALWLLRRRTMRDALAPLVSCAAVGVLLYLPVHLEGRYLAGFFAVLAVAVLSGVMGAEERTRRAVMAVVLVGVAAQVVKEQRVVWGRMVHGWSYKDNAEWQAAEAVEASGLARGSEVGMVSWTPSLHCDWAYLSGMQITSEIANGEDERVFWGMGAAGQEQVLGRFRAAAARAVLSWEQPPEGAGVGWQRLGDSRMWMYRF